MTAMTTTQLKLDIVNLFVRDFERAKRFYTETLGLPVIEELSGERFVALRPASGSSITLQDAAALPPGVAAEPGGMELGLLVEDVDAVHAEWHAKGVRLLTPPMDLPFGRTFLAADPDGHYLRVYRLK